MEYIRSSKLLPKKSKAPSGQDILTADKLSRVSCESATNRLYHTELSKFCPKKLFYIVFVNESDQNSASLIDTLLETSRNYEEVSSVTFISRDDVLRLLQPTKDFIFPNQVKPLFLDIIESIKEFKTENISSLGEAQLLKLKLIQVMYQQYVERVKENQKEKNLEVLLNYLTRECKRKQKKDETGGERGSPNKDVSPRTMEDVKKKGKRDDKRGSKEDDFDYSSVPLNDDNISYEENIFKHICFYCIKGFYNNEILQNFIEQLNSPLNAIIKIITTNTSNVDIPNHIDSFWENIDLQFFGNTTAFKYLEDTILMKFVPSKKCTEENVTDLFQEFVFVLRRIVDIKLTHLKFLRYLAINRIQNNYAIIPLECMQTYNKSIKKFPLECINGILVLDALLHEVCFHLDLKRDTRSFISSSGSLILTRSSFRSLPSVNCTNPLHGLQAFGNANKATSASSVKNNFTTFLVHKKNILLTILKSYKHVGPRIFHISLNQMKRIPILENVSLKTEDCSGDITHTHDIDPSKKFEVEDKATMDNFMYLFLFKCFRHAVELPQTPEEYNLTKNLITFDLLDFLNDVELKCSSENILEKNVNLYDTPLVHFRWKEKLASDLMIQEIFDATEYFSYWDQKYSPETDDFLVIFSDKLDKFGLNTKIYEVMVRTPICLRDFCRYTTVEDAEWLRGHETKVIDENTFHIELNEECPGAQKVKTQMKIFQEYAYLLDANIKEEIEDNQNENLIEKSSSLEKTIKSENIDFQEAYVDLQKYPTYKNLINECENASESEQILSYNLGSNIFKITGHTTTFSSHDGVKVTVDNTRFLQNPEKCTINVISDKNTLTLHSNESLTMKPYIVGILLKDGTRISFILTNQEKKKDLAKNQSKLDQISEQNEEEIQNIIYEGAMERNKQENSVKSSAAQVVHCVEEDFFKDLLGNDQTFENIAVNSDSDDLVEAILGARETNGIIYKINTKSTYLKRNRPVLKVPIEHALRDILPRNSLAFGKLKHYETHTKRFQSLDEDKTDLDVQNSLDFRLCLPNGLFISSYPSLYNETKLMIKQEYVEEKPNFVSVQHEEFRLFSHLGFIVIKKIDGTVTIFKANGDIIDFEKPTDGSGNEESLKPCHCSTLEDYRNKLNKMMKDDNADYYASRRGHITQKQNYILDKNLLNLLEHMNIPYVKKSIIRFDGRRIKIQGNKISQTQLHYMTTQRNFITEEIYYERTDNFRSTFERSGSQKILFPDGTLISNSVKMADELVDGFVYVTISFKYEHPNYAAVDYDDNYLKIILNNSVVFEKGWDEEHFTVNMKQNISISVSKEQVLFKKTCDDCSGSFECHFNINPFHINRWAPFEEFLNIQDTYNKYFYSDFVGNCSRKLDYIKGRMNKLNCNHFKRNNYKKLFIIKKDFTGERMISNDMTQFTIQNTKSSSDASVVYNEMLSNKNITTVDCRQKIFINYCNRFFNNSVINCFNSNTKTKEYYSTFRFFYTMFRSVKEIETHVLKLQEIYFQNIDNENIFKHIASLKSDLEIYKLYAQEMLDEQEQLEKMRTIQEEEARKRAQSVCSCIRHRMTMAEKVTNWRKTVEMCKRKIKDRKIPNYFLSDFCKINK